MPWKLVSRNIGFEGLPVWKEEAPFFSLRERYHGTSLPIGTAALLQLCLSIKGVLCIASRNPNTLGSFSKKSYFACGRGKK